MEDEARFELALDECCRRFNGGEPLETCLADYPAVFREELARLVPLSQRAASLARNPSPGFQARLERQLLAGLADARQEQRRHLFGWAFLSSAALARTAIVALLVLVVLTAGGFGAVQASDGSLPDDPLYQVKRAREWVQLALARDQQAQVNVRAEQVAARGGEVEKAVRAAKNKAVVEAVAVRLGRATAHMVDQALDARSGGNPQPARRALVAIRLMERRLAALEAQAPPDLRPALERMRVFLGEQEARLNGRANTAR